MIGEKITLVAKPADIPVTWKIDGLQPAAGGKAGTFIPSAVKSLSLGERPVALTRADLSANSITFFLAGQTRPLSISVYPQKAGEARPAVTTLDVYAPELRATATTCRLGANNLRRFNTDIGRYEPPGFGMGYNDACATEPGISWKLSAKARPLPGNESQVIRGWLGLTQPTRARSVSSA